MTTRRYYSSDLTNRAWAILEPLIPPPKPGGRPCRWERREIVDAILYVLRSGGIWRLLPHDFPPWQTVYHYFRLWRRDGTWERVHTRLREQARRRVGRAATPSAAILDSQSVKTTKKGGRVATTAVRVRTVWPKLAQKAKGWLAGSNPDNWIPDVRCNSSPAW